MRAVISCVIIRRLVSCFGITLFVISVCCHTVSQLIIHCHRSMYAGENFVRYTGEVSHIAERQMFAWDASGKGVDVHLQADPTKAELLHKNFEAKKEQFQETQKQSILEKVCSWRHALDDVVLTPDGCVGLGSMVEPSICRHRPRSC